MGKFSVFVLLFGLVGILGIQGAFAQNNTTATDQVRIVIHDVMRLELKNNLGGEARFEFQNRQQVEQGLELLGASSIGVKSNRDWNISVRTEADYFRADEGTSQLPANVLQVRVNGSPEYLPLSANNQILQSGQRGDDQRQGNAFDIDYRAHLNEQYYEPGNFSLGVIYTISQQ